MEKKRPCLLFLFGGAFKDKSDDCTQEIGKGMAQKGYVVAIIDYRLGFKNADSKIPCGGDFMTDMYEGNLRALQDARSAIRYLKANASKLGIDENKIFISGNSAGAITSLGIAFVEDKDIPQQQLKDIGGSLDAMKDNIQYDTKVAGVISLAGAIIEENVLSKKTNTPICLLQGNCDELIDLGAKHALNCGDKNPTFPILKGSEAIYMKAKENNSIKFYYVCNGGHLTFKWGHLNILEYVSKFTYSVLQGNTITGKEIIQPTNKVCNANCN
jgi:dienelactone hydrolase